MIPECCYAFSVTTPTAEHRLKAAGLRVTKQRLAVLRTVESGNHLDADTVIARVRDDIGHVSTQAVYDVLHALSAAGLVRSIEPAGSAARYDVRVGDNHHHLVCRACGAVVDVDCATGAAPCLEPADRHGFVVDEAEVLYWGLCPGCQDLLDRGREAAR